MSFEQPGYIRVPPPAMHGRLPPKPRPDFASRAWRSELPEAATDHTSRPKKVYAKGMYPKISQKLKQLPSPAKIHKLMVKHSRATLNPPPADASGELRLVNSRSAKGKKRTKVARKRSQSKAKHRGRKKARY